MKWWGDSEGIFGTRQWYGMASLTNDVHLSDACCVSLQFFCCHLELVNIASDCFNAIVGCLNAVTCVNHFCVHCVQLDIAVCQIFSASHTFL